MAVIFPDIEPILVAHLKTELVDAGYDDVYVATKRAQPDDEQSLQVIVNASYQGTVERVLREGSAVIEVFSTDYEDANQVALTVGAVLDSVVGDPIKMVEVSLGPVRLADDGPFERRSLSVDLMVKGTDF